jgi:hypothetical protein
MLCLSERAQTESVTEKRRLGGVGQRRVLRIHDAISMAYDRSLTQISAKDYHNKITETKETSHSCVTCERRSTEA